MIEKIIDLCYEDQSEINFEYIKNKRTTEENSLRLSELIRGIDPYEIKNFTLNIKQIKKDLENEIEEYENKKENEEEKAEFEKEIKKKSENDIKKLYIKFKRERGEIDED
jgi:Fic family protein